MAVLDRPRVQVQITQTGRAVFRGKYWAATNDQFAVTTYGPTNDEAIKRNIDAINQIVQQLSTLSEDEFTARLDKLNVQYEILDKSDRMLYAEATTVAGH